MLLAGGPPASADLTLSNQGLRLMTPLMTIISQDIKYRPTKVDHDTFGGFQWNFRASKDDEAFSLGY